MKTPAAWPTDRVIFQHAWVVNDIEAAATRWARSFGVGPFFVAHYRAEQFRDSNYRGQPGQLNMRTAIAYSGPVQIELIEPLDAGPNAYRDVYAPGEEGYHHLCLWSHDLDADIAHYEKSGSAVVNSAKMKGGPRFAYMDGRSQFGCMIELLEYSKPIDEMFAGWRSRCEAWQGDPVMIAL
ncbi:MAG: VOC family protein [Steroidobacteraceae bacterium]